MRPMRLFVLCTAADLVSSQALAGPIDGSAGLRGAGPGYDGEPVARPARFVPASPSYRRVAGLYFGGHAGIAGSRHGLQQRHAVAGRLHSSQ